MFKTTPLPTSLPTFDAQTLSFIKKAIAVRVRPGVRVEVSLTWEWEAGVAGRGTVWVTVRLSEQVGETVHEGTYRFCSLVDHTVVRSESDAVEFICAMVLKKHLPFYLD